MPPNRRRSRLPCAARCDYPCSILHSRLQVQVRKLGSPTVDGSPPYPFVHRLTVRSGHSGVQGFRAHRRPTAGEPILALETLGRKPRPEPARPSQAAAGAQSPGRAVRPGVDGGAGSEVDGDSELHAEQRGQ